MKTLIAAAMLAAGLAIAPQALAGDLTVELTGAQARPGKVYSTLSTRETLFRQGGRTAVSDAADGKVTVTFSDVPPGDYAFMAYHDEDEDGKMATGPGGMPAEGWALSNSERLMGPPTFDVLKFTVPAEGATIRTPLIYASGQ